MKKKRRNNKERTMELSSSQTFCMLLRSASRKAYTTNGEISSENIFFIQFARTVTFCTHDATFRVDGDDDQSAISACGDVYLARDDDVSLHRFLVVSQPKKRRRKRRKRRSEFHSEREEHQRRRHWKRRRKQQLERTVHERPETTGHGRASPLVTRGVLVATLNASKSDRGVRESQRKRLERAVLQTRHVCVFTRRVGTPLRQYVQLKRHRKRGRTDIR